MGEGFAFFRWHALRWPNSGQYLYGCGQPGGYCMSIWESQQKFAQERP